MDVHLEIVEDVHGDVHGLEIVEDACRKFDEDTKDEIVRMFSVAEKHVTNAVVDVTH